MSEFFKKVFAVLIAAFTAFSSLITGAINFQKHDLVIKLECNPSTGCSWLVEVDNEDVVKKNGSHYVQDFSLPGEAGVGGEESFYFDAGKDGEAKITMTYGQHWDGGSLFRTVIYTVSCKDGKLTVINTEDSNPKAS